MAFLMKRAPSAGFVRRAVLLFLTEWARSAYVIAFLPIFAQRQEISVAVVGAAISVHYAADTAVKAGAGYVLDRFRSRLVLHIFLFIGLIGLLMSYHAGASWQVLLGAALLGAGASPVWLLCLSNLREEQRGSQMGYIYTVWLAALGLGPVVVNLTIDIGTPIVFWLVAGAWLAGWALAADQRLAPQTGGAEATLKMRMSDLRHKLTAMKPLVPGMVLQTAAAGLLVPILPAFASDRLGLDLPAYTFVLVAGGAVTAACLIPMGKLFDRKGHKWLLIAGFGILSAALFLLPYARHYAGVLLIAVVLGAAYAAVLPAWNALMSYFVPAEQKATGWGVLSGVEGIGIMIGPLIGGWLGHRFGETSAVLVSAALLLSIALFYWIYPVHRFEAVRSGD